MLVITIIVLLILSGVTVTSLLGNNGLMAKGQDISTSTKRMQIVSNLKTDILTEQLDGDITKGQLEEILTEYGEVQYDDNGDITGVYVDDIDDVIEIDEVFTGTLAEEITDTTAPVATIELSSMSTSIGAAVTATVAHIDSESGVDITSCKYIYNTTSGTLGTTNSSWDTAAGFSSNPQTLSLTSSAMGTYYLHVLTADLTGNIAEVVSYAITVLDATAPTAEISLSATSTTAGTAITATVTHTDNDSGVDITNCKYIYNTTSGTLGTSSSSWSSATSFSSNPQTLTLSTSTVGTYYLHVLTADLAGNTAEVISSAVSVTDTTAPTIAISLSSTSTVTASSITAKVTHTDSQSGVNITSCKYIYNTTSGTLGTSSSSWSSATSFSSNPQTLTLKKTTAGTYYLHVLSVDNAGNKSEKTSSAITVVAIKTGDYVNYTPDTGSYTVAGDTTGSDTSSTQTFTTSSLSWRVLSVNESTGVIELVSATAGPKVTFRGPNGYNHAVNLLNELCNSLYSKTVNGTQVATGRSINAEDINSKTTYDYTSYTNYGTVYTPTYKKHPNIYLLELGSTKNGLNETTSLLEESEGVTNYSSYTGYSNPSTLYTTSTNYVYTLESYLDTSLGANTAPTGLLNVESNYWVASRGLYVESSTTPNWGLRLVTSAGKIKCTCLFDGGGNTVELSYAIRPVVTINRRHFY